MFDRFLDQLAARYLVLTGGPLQRIVAGGASRTDGLVYTVTLILLAAPLLFLAAAVEFILPPYLRVLALAWVVGVFFFLAVLDRRARGFLTR